MRSAKNALYDEKAIAYIRLDFGVDFGDSSGRPRDVVSRGHLRALGV